MNTRIPSRHLITFAAWFAASAVIAVPACATSTRVRKEIVLHNFCQSSGCPDGQLPYSPMVQDAKGNLYGVTVLGGNANNSGTIYELAKVRKTWVFRSLYSFCSQANCTDGSLPSAGLIIDTSGNLYGTATLGGNANEGVVFELRKNGKFKVLYSFCAETQCADGALPDGGLTYQGQQSGQLYNGISALYGTAEEGGPYSRGIVYTITPGDSESLLYGFGTDNNTDDGNGPTDPLIMDGKGNLYGTTGAGGSENVGTIFSVNPSGTETMSFSFCSQGSDCGFYPGQGGLLMTPEGVLVGATPNGGMYGDGVIYSFAAGTYATLASFCHASSCRSGGAARGGLIEDSSGNLYGVAPLGGKNGMNAGTVFELTGSHISVLYGFCAQTNCADGKEPYSKLIMDRRGHLFGTAAEGGAFNGGAVFELL